MQRQGIVSTQAKSAPPVAGGVLRRKCACGQHTGEGECTECKEEKGRLQRFAVHPTRPDRVPPIVHQALRSPGQPLDRATRSFMEPRFGANLSQIRTRSSVGQPATSALAIGAHDDVEEREADRVAARVAGGSGDRDGNVPAYDFSQVRVHTDALAGRAAQAVAARAYAVGQDIFFAPGQYAPGSTPGRSLLAHELAHTVQQAPSPTLRRLGFFETLGVALGLVEGDFSEQELRDYLGHLASDKKIEGGFDSDNKARVAIRRVQAGTLKVELTPVIKRFLILEMHDGWVTDGDREGMLTVLENSSPRDLLEIFAPGGITVQELRKDLASNPFHDRFETIVAQRLSGGKELVDKGITEPAGAVGFSEQELRDYVQSLKTQKRIAGSYGADKKAEAVVRQWKAGTLDVLLPPPIKRLLVLEMVNGGVTDEDREGVLEVLESSGVRDLLEIFGSSGITVKQLDGLLPAEPFRGRLDTIYSLHFKGGQAAVRGGTVEPVPGVDLAKMSAAERKQFLEKYFPAADRRFAGQILDDLAQVKDLLDFANQDELATEIAKRIKTSRLMRETQRLFGVAFEYPNHPAAKACRADKQPNPRVNRAAEPYWGPVQHGSPVPGYPETYYFELSTQGKENAYAALVSLFTPQKSICDMTLIHCDFLASVVHFRVFAETIGPQEFDDRVKKGLINMKLTYYGFEYLEQKLATSSKAISLQEVRPGSEKDLVIGDHVLFWNHRAYDLINEKIHNAWRLENAILTEKVKGEDYFLGHGSGRRTNPQMKKKLAQEYNKVVGLAEPIIQKTKPAGSPAAAKARQEMADKFPNVKEEGATWKIKGAAHSKNFNEPLKKISDQDPELIGLHDPEAPTQMNIVKRPIESF